MLTIYIARSVPLLALVAFTFTLTTAITPAAASDLDEDQSTSSPFPLPANTTLEKDIAYGIHARQKFDVYRPRNVENAPAILLVHGGGWAIGDKAADAVVVNKVKRWTAKGLVVISINYRLLPDAEPLAQADDVAQALAFAQRNAARWAVDPNRFILMGHSAGAHLVALLTASPDIAKQAGALRWLGTVALDSAAFDVEAIMKVRHFRLYDKAFGKDVAVWRAASPLQVLAAGAPPLLAVCSTEREIACQQARNFAERGKALAVRVQVLPQQRSHREINQALGIDNDYTRAVETFLASLDPILATKLMPQ